MEDTSPRIRVPRNVFGEMLLGSLTYAHLHQLCLAMGKMKGEPYGEVLSYLDHSQSGLSLLTHCSESK